MTIQPFADLIEYFREVEGGTKACHEHRAKHTSKHGIDTDAAIYTMLGYMIRKKVDGENGKTSCAFLQKGNDRLKIILSDVPEHEAWTVEEVKAFERLKSFFCKVGLKFIHQPGFDINRDDLKSIMLQHKESGIFFQIIWRQQQIFTDVFPFRCKTES